MISEKRFEERQKQIQLAQEQGEIHIGEEANPKDLNDQISINLDLRYLIAELLFLYFQNFH